MWCAVRVGSLLLAVAACGGQAAAPAATSTVATGPRLHVVVDGEDDQATTAVTAALGREGDVQLARGPAGYRIAPTTTVAIERDSRGGAMVRCELAMLITTWPKRAMIATQRGQAEIRVEGGAARIAEGVRECVAAVADQLVHDRVVPALRARDRAGS